MRIAVVGAGALGSLYAGMLARAGTDVTLLGRSPEHIDMIRAEGLRMTVQEKADWTVRLAATIDAHIIGQVDTVIFLTKTPDVQQAAIGARALFGPATLAVTLQNGLGAPEAVAAALGPVAIAAGVSEIGGDIIAPGHLEMTENVLLGSGMTRIGSHATSAAPDALAAVADVLNGAGLPTVVMDDIDTFVWAKLGAAGTMSSISALTRLRIGPNSDTPAGVRLIERMMGEIVAVAQARGIAIDLETVRERAFGTYRSVPNHVPSMAADLRAGRRTEVECLSGAVAREGARLGVPTPMCAILTDMIALVENHPGQSIW